MPKSNVYPQINLYNKFTPNTGGTGGRYYYPDVKETTNVTGRDYKLQLIEQYKNDAGSTQFYEGRTYKIYENYIDLYTPDNLYSINYTYITIDTGAEIYFYYVTRTVPIVNGVRFYIEADLWAQYVDIAQITQCTFSKSNVQLGDSATNVTPVYTISGLPSFDNCGMRIFDTPVTAGQIGQLSRQQISIFAVITWEREDNLDDSIRQQDLYLVNIRQIVGKEIWTGGTVKNLTQDDVLNAINAVASIFQVPTGINQPALTQKIYLFTTDGYFLSTRFYDDEPVGQFIGQKFEAFYNGTRKTIYGKVVYPQIINFKFACKIGDYLNNDFSQPPFNSTYFPSTNLYELKNCTGAKITFGTKYNGIEIPTCINILQINLRVEMLKSGINFILSCNTKEKDVSDSFSIPFIDNSGSYTSFEQMSRALKVISGVGSGILGIVTGGLGALAGVGAGVKSIGSVVLDPAEGVSPQGGGSGYLTFDDIITDDSGYIFAFNIYQDSKYNPALSNPTPYYMGYIAEKRAANEGANITYYYNGDLKAALTEAATSTDKIIKIFNSSIDSDQETSAVIALTASITGIPKEAADYIEEQFNNGIRLYFVSNPDETE